MEAMVKIPITAVPKLRNLRVNEAAKRSKCVAAGVASCDGALSPPSTRSQSRLTAYKLAQDRGKFIAVPTAEPHSPSDCSTLALDLSGFEKEDRSKFLSSSFPYKNKAPIQIWTRDLV
jgi:hypothetical protein